MAKGLNRPILKNQVKSLLKDKSLRDNLDSRGFTLVDRVEMLLVGIGRAAMFSQFVDAINYNELLDCYLPQIKVINHDPNILFSYYLETFLPEQLLTLSQELKSNLIQYRFDPHFMDKPSLLKELIGWISTDEANTEEIGSMIQLMEKMSQPLPIKLPENFNLKREYNSLCGLLRQHGEDTLLSDVNYAATASLFSFGRVEYINKPKKRVWQIWPHTWSKQLRNKEEREQNSRVTKLMRGQHQFMTTLKLPDPESTFVNYTPYTRRNVERIFSLHLHYLMHSLQTFPIPQYTAIKYILGVKEPLEDFWHGYFTTTSEKYPVIPMTKVITSCVLDHKDKKTEMLAQVFLTAMDEYAMGRMAAEASSLLPSSIGPRKAYDFSNRFLRNYDRIKPARESKSVRKMETLLNSTLFGEEGEVARAIAEAPSLTHDVHPDNFAMYVLETEGIRTLLEILEGKELPLWAQKSKEGIAKIVNSVERGYEISPRSFQQFSRNIRSVFYALDIGRVFKEKSSCHLERPMWIHRNERFPNTPIFMVEQEYEFMKAKVINLALHLSSRMISYLFRTAQDEGPDYTNRRVDVDVAIHQLQMLVTDISTRSLRNEWNAASARSIETEYYQQIQAILTKTALFNQGNRINQEWFNELYSTEVDYNNSVLSLTAEDFVYEWDARSVGFVRDFVSMNYIYEHGGSEVEDLWYASCAMQGLKQGVIRQFEKYLRRMDKTKMPSSSKENMLLTEVALNLYDLSREYGFSYRESKPYWNKKQSTEKRLVELNLTQLAGGAASGEFSERIWTNIEKLGSLTLPESLENKYLLEVIGSYLFLYNQLEERFL
ncbi:MAG: hypothetical protein ABIJ34_07260 [archaeon]